MWFCGLLARKFQFVFTDDHDAPVLYLHAYNLWGEIARCCHHPAALAVWQNHLRCKFKSHGFFLRSQSQAMQRTSR